MHGTKLMKHLIVALLLTSCATSPTVKDNLTVPLNASWPNADWQAYAYEKAKDLPRTTDEKEFCPQGLTTANWVHLMSAMAYYESGYSPAKTYREKFKNGRGEYVISTGLFQVSYESSRGYGYPGITTADLKAPLLNIDVAVSILKKLTLRDGVVANHSGQPWLGGQRYWSVLRTTGKLAQIKARMKEHCQ